MSEVTQEVTEASGSSVSETTEAPATAEPAKAEVGAGQGKEEGSTSTDPKATDGSPLPPEAVAPSYKARDKFKVMVFGSDEQKEHDVPDWLKPLMKDAASEKQVMSLLEKAYGLEPVMQSRTQVRQERDKYKQDFGGLQKSINEVRTAYQRGDIDQWLEKMSVPKERMLQWALDKVNYSQLPLEQQRILDERQDAQRRAHSAEQDREGYMSQMQEQARQTKMMLLTAGLARPDVKTFSDEFDAKVGKPGSFYQEVVAAGELAWMQSGGKVDLTPEQAIEQALTKWRTFLPPSTQAAPAPVAGQPGVVLPSGERASTLPNISGRTSSPVKAGPKSLDDLRKLKAQSAH